MKAHTAGRCNRTAATRRGPAMLPALSAPSVTVYLSLKIFF